jgi:hypothetical protein
MICAKAVAPRAVAEIDETPKSEGRLSRAWRLTHMAW